MATATGKRYKVLMGFNVVTDPVKDPEGQRFEAGKIVAHDDLPEITDIRGLLEVGALQPIKARGGAAAEE